jgi:hypothetical protein
LDELVKRVAGFLIDEEDEMIKLHRFNQLVNAERFVVGLVSVEEYREVVVTVATTNRDAITLGEPALDLVGFNDDAERHGEGVLG